MGCGHPLDQSTAAAVPNQWVAEEVVCNGCAAIEMASRKERPDGSKNLPAGTRFRVRDRSA